MEESCGLWICVVTRSVGWESEGWEPRKQSRVGSRVGAICGLGVSRVEAICGLWICLCFRNLWVGRLTGGGNRGAVGLSVFAFGVVGASRVGAREGVAGGRMGGVRLGVCRLTIRRYLVAMDVGER